MGEIRTFAEGERAPRVVLIGLASCFGCQINITNIEEHLLAVLGQIDMAYWQLTSSESMRLQKQNSEGMQLTPTMSVAFLWAA